MLLLFVSSCQKTSQIEQSQKTETVSVKNNSFFLSVPISRHSFGQVPCIEVQIESKSYNLLLDLGTTADVILQKHLIDQLISKRFLKNSSIFGIRGKEYLTSLYEIPRVEIGDMIFKNCILENENQEWSKDAISLRKEPDQVNEELGSVGWGLFRPSNLLLDLKNSKIIFSDSVTTLRNQQGYFIENFAKVPLIVERGVIEFKAKTPEGSFMCMLDTGCTISMMHSGLDKTFEEVIGDPSYYHQQSCFKIDDMEFGPLRFVLAPIKYPIHIDAILGMDFFRSHLVFIDFKEKQIYFSKYEDK